MKFDIKVYYLYKRTIYITAASFSETFYGLKRVTVKDSKVKLNLDNRRLNLSLIILVVFPYLQRKIENWENQSHDLNRVSKTFFISLILH